MNSVFSVDDFSDPFWQSQDASMNRSASEWALEKFLQEISDPASSSSDTTTTNHTTTNNATTSSSKAEDDVVEIQKPQVSSDRNTAAPIDSEEYRAFLKSRLELACAAVAMSKVSSVKPEDLCSLAESQRVGSAADAQLRPQPIGSDHGTSLPRNEANSGSVALPVVPAVQQKQDGQAKQTTSGSSREDSDDDDVEGETETNTDPADAKRARRMQSNRESARRSRRRKQQQLNELETQVGQLRDERTSLLSRHSDVNKKCDDASVDNRILKANIETLRTKVKMAEEQVKRITGINPMLMARSNMSGMGMQFVGSQMNASTNVGLPMPPSCDQLFRQHVPDINPAAPNLHRLTGGFPNTTTMVPLETNLRTDNARNGVGEMNSIKHASSRQSISDLPSMQQVQKQVSSTVGAIGSLPVHESGASHVIAKDSNKKK